MKMGIKWIVLCWPLFGFAQQIDTVMRLGATRYVFSGTTVATYRPQTAHTAHQKTAFQPLSTMFPQSPFVGVIDAAVAVGNGTTLLFQGKTVALFTYRHGKLKFSNATTLSEAFPACPFQTIDAAFWQGWQHRLYLVSHDQVARYAWADNSEDRRLTDGDPVALTTLFPNFPKQSEAIFWKDNGVLNVIVGTTWVGYDVRRHTVTAPRPLAEMVDFP